MGPPGTGKTLGAQVLSVELGLPFYDISGLVKGQNAPIGQLFGALRDIAKKSKKGLIAFIDEVEGLSSRKEVVDPLQYQALTQFLTEMQGVKNNHGIFMIGTTNRANDLDEAIRSRFDEEVEFLPPDKKGRYEILKIHANKKGGHKFEVTEKDLEKLADKSYGYVGRDLKQVLNRSFTHAKKSGSNKVNFEDLEYGIKKTKPSAIRDMPFIEPDVKFEDLAGYEDHKALLESILDKTEENVILFYGPKGTGKTLMAEAVAGQYGYNYILLKGSELESKWVGESKDNVEKVIARAKQLSPCVVCFDEISSFVERRGVLSHKDSQTGYMQSVLSRPPQGVYIIGTDNNPDFLRGPFMDRFVHKLYFGKPTEKDQLALWKKYAPKVNAKQLLKIRKDLSCRDIAYTCKRITEFGAELNLETIRKMIRGIPEDEDVKKYEEVIKEVGDGVEDYRRLK
ncbi:AAA family ATPase [Candidatus Woesearchaeota archaeon]|nr:AAA family ATPase [Candidatus Woesearchaeota archaeon]